ncbi:MAG TPA: YXWGXW repeat-containing protein [Polyangiaceae bacterium]|nr:YXWGXW repeat-containing protein [Polyangiaceae bacterium]
MSCFLVFATTLLSGCGGHFPRPPYSAQPTSALVELKDPLPPARVEAVPVRPATAGAVWIDGEWTVRRGRWAWVPGRWVVPPPGETYSPWVIVRGPDGRLWHAPGTWRDARGNAVDEPPSLAVASVESQPVVSASGEIEVTGRTVKPTSKKPAK